MNSCNRTTNNKYFNCPPRMADGRHFTDYRASCNIMNTLHSTNNITSSFQSREFLTDNANKLIELNRKQACEKNCCGPCVEPYNQGTMLPERNIEQCSKTTCDFKVLNENGIGLGRDYGYSKCGLKELPVNQTYSCCAPTNKLFNYYNHVDRKTQGELFPRLTVPGGGKAMSGGDPQAYNL
jgi:hypothetical protein